MNILDIKLKNNLNSEKGFEQFINAKNIETLEVDRIIYGNPKNPKTAYPDKLEYFIDWLEEKNKDKNNFTICFNSDLNKLILNRLFNQEDVKLQLIDMKDIFHRLSFMFFEEKTMYSFFQIPDYEDSKLSSLYLVLDDFINELDKTIISLNYRIPYANKNISFLPVKNKSLFNFKKIEDLSFFEFNLLFKKDAELSFTFDDGYNINNVRYMIMYYLLVQNNAVKDFDFMNIDDEKKFNKKLNELLKSNIYSIKKDFLESFKTLANIFFHSKDKEVDIKEIKQQIIDFSSEINYNDLEF